LRRSLDLSYAVLDDKARRLLLELAMLAPKQGFTLSDVEAIGMKLSMERWAWEDALQQLGDATMARVADDGEWSHLHPLVAEYARDLAGGFAD